MDSVLITMVLVFVGVVILPPLAPRLRVPVMVLELIYGMIIGRSFLNVVQDNQIITFFSDFGLVFLMFLAGMEMDLRLINRKNLRKVLIIALTSLIVPFLAGTAISPLVNMSPFLLGTLLCTTSLGLLMPVLKDLPLKRSEGQLLLVSVIIVDIASMFILAFVLAALQGSLQIDIIYSLLAIVVIFLVPWTIRKKKLRRKFTFKLWKKQYFEMEMRAAFFIIFILAAATYELGFHSIIGAFIGGILVSEILPHKTLEEEKLQSFGYSFFIPMFFIFIGAKVNLGPVFSQLDNIGILALIILVGMVSKLAGVTLAGRISGLKIRQSIAFGFFHTARLSLIIAAVDIALKLEFLDESLFAIFILLAIVSAVVAPSVGKQVLAGEEKTATC